MLDMNHHKLDPLLRPLAIVGFRPVNATEATDTSVPLLPVLIAFSGSQANLTALGVIVSSFANGIAIAALTADQLAIVAADPRGHTIEVA